MQVIIVGAGNVGYTLARTLSKNHSVMMVEIDEKRYEKVVESLDIGAINANGASPRVLKDIMKAETDLFLAVTERDEFNIFACLVAKQIRPEAVTFARVRNPEYLGGVLRSDAMGVDRTISPERLTAAKMRHVAMMENLVDYESLPVLGLELGVFRVAAKHDAALFKPLRYMELPPGSALVAIHRKGEVLMPGDTERLATGDDVTIIGRPGTVEAFNSALGKVKERRDLMIVGGGILAEHLLTLLEAENCTIKLIEKDETSCRRLSRRFDKAVIINDSGTDPSVLRNENVNMSDALICTAENEEENLLSCLIGKHLGVHKTITKYSRREYEKVFNMSGVDVAIGYYHVVANEIVKQIVPELEMLLLLEGFQEVLVGITVHERSRMSGTLVVDLDLPARSVLAMIIKNGGPMVPRPDMELNDGDVVLIYASRQDVPRLERMFHTKIPLGP
ncbi:MAG: Trk system potassium transporter TrkA [Methanomassiliicoccus sp.]|nr:Trk system potassium transporter TrkA [Methanomassiliicoccus sp.]